jgi:hypothetical protein
LSSWNVTDRARHNQSTLLVCAIIPENPAELRPAETVAAPAEAVYYKKMSYLVLALGVLLSLCGAFAIYAGYGIIEVERGWTSVIAGSTALSCGIVTIALGIILHRLSGLHALLKTVNGLMLLPREAGREASEPHRENSLAVTSGASMPEAGLPRAAMPPAAAVPAVSWQTWLPRPVRSNPTSARNYLKSRGTVSSAATEVPESDYAAPISHDAFRVAKAATEPPPKPGFAMPAEVEAAKDEAETRPTSLSGEALAEDEAAAAEDNAKEPPIEPPLSEMPLNRGEPETQPEPHVVCPAETASIETIFNEELRIEQDPAWNTRKVGAEPSPKAGEPANLDPAPPFVSEVSDAEPSPEPSPSPAPVVVEEGLTIVAYESGGTSYVMYSDGTIEARTEHEVFHFKSMAELKAFMESPR